MGFKHKNYKQRQQDEKTADMILCILLIAYLVFHIMPVFKRISSALPVRISEYIIMTAIIIYYSWFRRRKPILFIRICTTVLGVLFFWLPPLISSNRILCLIFTGLLLFTACIFIYSLIRDSDNTNMLLTFEAVFYLIFVLDFSRYTKQTNKLAFLLIPIIISICFSALATIVGSLVLKKRKSWAQKKAKKEHVGPLILVAFFTLIFSWMISYITVDNLNYVFDSSRPASYSAKIVDKSYTGRNRNIRSYRLKLEINGETVWIYVTSSQYSSYSAGEDFEVNLYNGAFGEQYFISEDID